MGRRRVAIVVQRYGSDFAGGAEYLARMYAAKFAELWDVEVLTTCAKDYLTWSDFYPAGLATEDGIPIRRFPVASSRDFAGFCQESYRREISSHTMTPEQEAAYFREQGPYAPELVNYLEQAYDAFDTFIFFTYLYYPTIAGLPKVADKSYLVATAHDEPPFYFVRSLAPIFASVRGIIYLADAERRLIEKTYKLPASVRKIHGMFGISPATNYTPEEEASYRRKYADLLKFSYFLFMGRASPSKHCGELIRSFGAGRHMTGAQLNLGFIGSMDFDFQERDDVRYWGFVDEKEKSFLLKNASALVNPSPFESLSLVCLEALNHGTPIIVNGACSVTKDLCLRSQGGLYYNSDTTFDGVMAWAMANLDKMSKFGSQGQGWVQQNYNWHCASETTLKMID